MDTAYSNPSRYGRFLIKQIGRLEPHEYKGLQYCRVENEITIAQLCDPLEPQVEPAAFWKINSLDVCLWMNHYWIVVNQVRPIYKHRKIHLELRRLDGDCDDGPGSESW